MAKWTDFETHPVGAANRIEELEAKMKWADEISNIQAARIEELKANINTKADFIDATINQLAASDQRIEELEAKLAKALDGLRDIIDAGGCFGAASHMENVDRIARTTLAELKEQDDD